ncbi:MAG: DUF202 domain-containing protein [Gammaproteobacteria bacterium]
MIDNFRDHAANERTYLAWIRTAIALMAFGFVIEKFDLFLRYLTIATNVHIHISGQHAEGAGGSVVTGKLFHFKDRNTADGLGQEI